MNQPAADDRERRIRAYLAGSLPREEAEAFERACFEDDELGAELERALEIQAASSTARTGRASPVRPRSPQWFAMAAGIAALAFGAILWMQRTPPDGPVMRAGEDKLAVTVDPVSNGLRLGWPAVAGAEAYRVEIFTASGERLTRAELAAPPYLLSDAVTPGDGGELYARIVALDHLRRPIADSGLVRAR